MRGGQCEKRHDSPATVKLVNLITMEEINFCLFTVFSGIYVALILQGMLKSNLHNNATEVKHTKHAYTADNIWTCAKCEVREPKFICTACFSHISVSLKFT